MKKKLTAQEVTQLISVGFCQPKFYKRSVWLKAKKIMDKLVSLNVGVVPHNYGHGKGKYTMISKTTFVNYSYLASIYINNLK